jgi:hypothetical protein
MSWQLISKMITIMSVSLELKSCLNMTMIDTSGMVGDGLKPTGHSFYIHNSLYLYLLVSLALYGNLPLSVHPYFSVPLREMVFYSFILTKKNNLTNKFKGTVSRDLMRKKRPAEGFIG